MGLAPDRPAVLVQPGSGANRDIVELTDRLVSDLRRFDGLQIIIAEWSNGAISLPHWPGTRRLRGFPISRHFNAFDFFRGGGGLQHVPRGHRPRTADDLRGQPASVHGRPGRARRIRAGSRRRLRPEGAGDASLSDPVPRHAHPRGPMPSCARAARRSTGPTGPPRLPRSSRDLRASRHERARSQEDGDTRRLHGRQHGGAVLPDRRYLRTRAAGGRRGRHHNPAMARRAQTATLRPARSAAARGRRALAVAHEADQGAEAQPRPRRAACGHGARNALRHAFRSDRRASEDGRAPDRTPDPALAGYAAPCS